VQPTICPTCGSDRRDFCVGHCPDNWHGRGPISNVCVVDSTGKVVYPLPKVERYGYIGESGLTRYRVQYDTDGVGRSLYRDATPEEVSGFLAEKEAKLVEAAELLKAKKERKIMHTEQEKDRARECANLVLECCADIYEYGRVSGLPSDMSDALESATCKILAYHDEQSQIYKDEITRLQGELESEYRRGRRDAGVARQSQTLEAKYQKAICALREIQWKSPRSKGSNEHCPACNNWRFNCGGKGVHDGNCPIGNALKDAPAEKNNE